MRYGLILLYTALVLIPFAAFAAGDPTPQALATQSIEGNDTKNYLTLSVENDVLGGGTDQFYTSGVRLTYFNVNTQVPVGFEMLDDHIPTFDINTTTSTSYSIGQNIYTPERIDVAEAQEDDRPWAAFLYGSIGLTTLEDNHIDDIELTLGIVGPEALGEQTQKFIHSHISSSPTPEGWRNQLDFEPGVILSLQRRWPELLTQKIGGYRFSAEPNINMSLGNIYTYAGTGVMFTFGPDQNLWRDTPTRVRPALPGTGYFETPPHGFGWYTFAGVDGRAVGRNIFLDGNTFTDSPSVDKNYFVGDLTAGAALTYDDYQLTYSLNWRSDEFRNQDASSIFGALTLSTKF
jgi:hypothetical protein